MRVMITNSSNPTAYPIAGFTWILANKEQADQAKGKALVDFLMWAVKDGQTFTSGLDYAPLSPAAAAKAETLIRSITYQGTPLAN